MRYSLAQHTSLFARRTSLWLSFESSHLPLCCSTQEFPYNTKELLKCNMVILYIAGSFLLNSNSGSHCK